MQFPLNVPLPVSLIKKIVLFKQAECLMPNTKNKLAPKDNNVSIFTNTLSSSLKPEVLLLKKIILAANKNLSENIKWNAPNFHINGEDRITMRLQDGKPIQLILHRGAKVKVLPKENLISDKLLLLTWKTTDRAIISFTNIEDINSKATNLKIIVNKWLKATK